MIGLMIFPLPQAAFGRRLRTGMHLILKLKLVVRGTLTLIYLVEHVKVHMQVLVEIVHVFNAAEPRCLLSRLLAWFLLKCKSIVFRVHL
jgi:hypothetical protein